jgi:hypothetical protein
MSVAGFGGMGREVAGWRGDERGQREAVAELVVSEHRRGAALCGA